MSGTIHLSNFELNGGGLCEVSNYANNRFPVTLDYLASDCQECRRRYRDQVQLHQNLSAEEKDILRIMFEQNCSRKTAEYVHEAGAKLKARILAKRANNTTGGN